MGAICSLDFHTIDVFWWLDWDYSLPFWGASITAVVMCPLPQHTIKTCPVLVGVNFIHLDEELSDRFFCCRINYLSLYYLVPWGHLPADVHKPSHLIWKLPCLLWFSLQVSFLGKWRISLFTCRKSWAKPRLCHWLGVSHNILLRPETLASLVSLLEIQKLRLGPRSPETKSA